MKFIGVTGFGMGLVPFSQCAAQSSAAKPAGKFVLWQLPSQTPSQMNSYVLQTDKGKVIVIDGGTAGDAAYLKGFLAALGNRVEAWFVSHPHSDHVNAITELLNNPGGLTVNKMYGSMPEVKWIEQYEKDALPSTLNLNKALEKSSHKIIEHTIGQVILIDGIRFEIMAIKNPEITQNPINNSSVVMKVTDSKRTVLFTGDLGVEGGEKLLKGPCGAKLEAEYVQMAHHGQNGVNEKFYQAVKPRYCLWPTPLWLWDNDNGGGKDSGPWVTLNVRSWMDKLNIQKHYVSCFGLCKIE